MDNVEILDLGIVYFKKAIKDPDKIILNVEQLNDKFLINQNVETQVSDWKKWTYDDDDFCYQKYIRPVKQISKTDFFYKESYEISNDLFSSLDKHIDEYKKIYPEINIKSRDDAMHILKYIKGGFLPAHQDHGVSTRTLSVLMYLNDDYKGGNLVFKNSNLSFKPEAGSILFFPSNFLYVHEVEEITNGIKYSLPNWYHNVIEKDRLFSTGKA